MAPTIELLASHHDRSAFRCGVEALDTYLKIQASQDVKRRIATCYVLCELGTPAILGYYTLSAHSLETTALPEALAKKLPRYPLLPATLLGRLAVDARLSGQGMGELLLLDAIHRTLQANIATMALLVDALDARAASFYRHYGFQPFMEAPSRLYLILNQVRGRL